MARWHRLVDWLLSEEPATSLALFRIAIGLIMLWDLGSMYLSDAMTLLWLPPSHGGLRQPGAEGLLARVIEPTGAAVWGVYGAAMLGAISLTIGALPRLGAAVLLLSFPWLVSLFAATGGGHDRLLTNAMFLLIFARSGATLSLQCWLQHRRWRAGTLVSGWPRRVLVWQLIIMYTATGMQKIGITWWPMGDFLAVHHALLLPQWARQDWSWIAWLSPLTQLGTAVTVVWESTWGVVLWWLWLRDTADRGGRLRRLAERVNLRRVYVLIGIVFHSTLWVMMNLGPFSAVTLAYYLCLYRGQEWRRADTSPTHSDL